MYSPLGKASELFAPLYGLCRSAVSVVSADAGFLPHSCYFRKLVEHILEEVRRVATNRMVVIGCGDGRALDICDDHGVEAEWSRQLV